MHFNAIEALAGELRFLFYRRHSPIVIHFSDRTKQSNKAEYVTPSLAQFSVASPRHSSERS